MQEEGRITRACRILGDVSDTLAQQNASAQDAICTVSAVTASSASLERKTVEVYQQMVGLAIQDGTQQPGTVPPLPEPATTTASEESSGTRHANVHDRPTPSRTLTLPEQLTFDSVPAESEHPSPQQTPRVGLSTILENAPDQAHMLTNLVAPVSQQAGPSQHHDGLLWMGINMLTAEDVGARALAAAAAHSNAAEYPHGSGAFSLTSDLSPESEDSQLADENQLSPTTVLYEGPASAPDFGRTPVHRVPSGLTAQLRGEGPLGGHGLRAGAEADRFGAFWPDGGSVRRVIRQQEYLVEEVVEDFEDASENFFGEMSLSSGSTQAGVHDTSNSSSSSSSANVSLPDVGCSIERSVQNVEDTQPSALTNTASLSGHSAAEFSTDVEQVMRSIWQSGGSTTKALDTTAPLVAEGAKQSEDAWAGMWKPDADAFDSVAGHFDEQDAAATQPSGATQDDDILHELDNFLKTEPQLPDSCTLPASQEMDNFLKTEPQLPDSCTPPASQELDNFLKTEPQLPDSCTPPASQERLPEQATTSPDRCDILPNGYSINEHFALFTPCLPVSDEKRNTLMRMSLKPRQCISAVPKILCKPRWQCQGEGICVLTLDCCLPGPAGRPH